MVVTPQIIKNRLNYPGYADNYVDYWSNVADDIYCHIDISGHLVDSRSLNEYWLNCFILKIDWHGKSVIDYGCGGGYLGLALNAYISEYLGLDISDKSLSAAGKLHEMKNVRSELKKLPVKLQDYSNYDILVCQAVIHHFPDKKHLIGFLDNVNESGINELVLQIRHNDRVFFQPDNPGNCCWVNEPYITAGLGNYVVEWKSEIDPKGQCQYIKYKRK